MNRIYKTKQKDGTTLIETWECDLKEFDTESYYERIKLIKSEIISNNSVKELEERIKELESLLGVDESEQDTTD